jgi:predicted kinase
VTLDAETRTALDVRFGTPDSPRLDAPRADAEVVLIGGLSGAGKSTAVAAWVSRGYERLNRDERGGTLARLVARLDQRLAAGARHVVLDNTYLTRASRADVLRAAHRHGVGARLVWLDTPPAEAQRNVVERMLAAHGALLPPEALAGKDDPTRLGPRVLQTQLASLELPDDDEGFVAVERVPFVRAPRDGDATARAVALDVLVAAGPAALAAGPPGPRLVFAWLPDGDAALVAATAGLDVERAACTHPAGPPVCWCRPPLPGLLLAFAHRHGIDPARLTVVGTTTAHRRLAEAAGARYEPA